MRFTVRIWRQPGPHAEGRLVRYVVDGITGDMSFLEMLDALNEQLAADGDPPSRSTTTAAKASAA